MLFFKLGTVEVWSQEAEDNGAGVCVWEHDMLVDGEDTGVKEEETLSAPVTADMLRSERLQVKSSWLCAVYM